LLKTSKLRILDQNQSNFFWNHEIPGAGILTHYRPAMPFGNRNIYFKEAFGSVLPQFKEYHLSGNLNLNNLGIFQSLKLRILMEKNPLNFS